MNEKLIEEVAAEVLRRQQQTQRTALLIGKKPPQAMGWRYVLSGEADAVLIGSLSAGQLLQFPDEVCADALLSGKPVFLWEGGLEYRRHARTANRALWGRLLAAERQMKQLGVQFLGGSASPLLTAAEARRLLAAGTLPPAGQRMTPLARDILEGKA